MDTGAQQENVARQAALVGGSGIVAFLAFAAATGLPGNARSFVVLGALRVVLFAALLAYVVHSGTSSRLGRVGLGFVAVTTVSYLVGGIGAAVTDGWSLDVLTEENTTYTPWYAYVLGASFLVYAVGTLLVGLATRRARPGPARALMAAGLVAPFAIGVSESVGHVAGHTLLLAPWLVFTALVAAPGRRLAHAPSRAG